MLRRPRYPSCESFQKFLTRLWRPFHLEVLEARDVPAIVSFDALAIDPNWYDSSTILVRVDPGVKDLSSLSISGAVSAIPLSLVPGLWEVQLAPGTSVTDVYLSTSINPLVTQVSFNYRVGLQQIPNDTLFSDQWAWNNTGTTGSTADADIDAVEAWDIFTGSADTIVAVIDTGVDYTHPDLAANMWVNTGEVAGNGIDDDANGYVDDIHGYDFANNDGDPMDDHGHGTHVSGTIGAVGDNNLGVTGLNWHVQIMALKFLDASGSGTVADAIRALNYAVANGATVSNNSYGGSAAEDADPLFREAILNAGEAGHIFVAGAGNASTNNDITGFYPATFDLDNIISVAATDQNDRLASFSNYGPTTVDVAAPGVNILSTFPDGQYGLNTGTSMATPHVTGIVALVRGLHPDWTYQQVIDRVLSTVDYVPSLDGRILTAGRVNAARALLDTDGPRVVATDPATAVGGVVTRVRVSFNEPVDPATFTTADILGFTGPNGAITVTGVAPVAGSFNRVYEVTFAPQITRGNYQLVLGPNLADNAGNLMDQDGDGVLGETTQDRYTLNFAIGDEYVFTSADTPKSLASFAVTRSTLTVTNDVGIADLNVRLNLASPDVGYVSVVLVSPTGVRTTLVPMSVAELGPEFRDTVFSDQATATISGGTSPFTGTFRPESPLSVMNGMSTQGTWALEVLSLFGGAINDWSMIVVAAPPRVTVGDVSIAEGNSGTSLATFTVRLSNPIDQQVTVDYATADGTGVAGDDYDAASGTITFAPGETEQTIMVAVRGDLTDELDETFLVNLSNANGATISDAQAVGTIKNDERTVSIGDATVTEGNGGTTNAAFTVTLSAPSTHVVTVTYTAAPATATANIDYVPITGTLTFQPGETTKTATVQVKGETRYERNETFYVNVTAAHALVTDGQGVGTITNDDPIPLVTVNDPTVVEGSNGTRNLVYTVRLANQSDFATTVNYTTGTGTATAGTDYTPVSGTLSFAPGVTALSVVVPVFGDADLEPSETIPLQLTSATRAVLLDSLGVGTILTDDQSLAVGDVTVAETNSGTFATTFTVSLSSAVPFEVRVNYATANNTAVSGSDYVATTGTLVFAPGETSKTVTVLGIGETRNEQAETFNLNLSAAVNATVADTQGRATITDDDPIPTVSVSDASVIEGDSGNRTLSFTLTLSAVSGQNVIVSYTTASGTAIAGSDYTAAAGTFTIGAGARTAVLNLNVTGETTAELDETLLLNLVSATNAILGDSEAVGTIRDDDSLVVDDVTLVEGDSGATVAQFAVRLLAAQDHAITVDYSTGNGSAIGASDYLARTGTITFAAGETEKFVDVVVMGDRGHEADETFVLNLSNATGTVISDAQGVATITNDDTAPSVTVSDAVVVEGPSGTRNAVFTLKLSKPSGQNVSVSYITADGTATTANADYQFRSGSVNFGAGSTTATISIPVTGDTADEGDETFVLNLTGATNTTLDDTQAIATVIDDDPLPAVSIADAATTEGNSGPRALGFTVTLSAASTQTITVQVSTSDGTATAGSDYTASTQTVTFTPGQTSKAVSFVLTGDAVSEASETFLVTLSNPTNAVLGDAQGTGTIQNDDSALRVNDVTVTEGDDGVAVATFTVTLTGPLSADPVTVSYSTSNGTAIGGADFAAATGTLTFAPGETTRTVDVLVAGDRVNEANETFNLNLSGAVNATVADAQGVATIANDDDAIPTVSVSDAIITEGASGTRNLNFTVRLSAVSGKPVTVSYATANGTATAGSDYVARSGVVTINPGSLTQTVTVVLTGDTLAEDDETLLVNLTGATNATVLDAQAVGTIQDDDSLVVDDVTLVEGDDGAVVAQFTVRLLAARDHAVSVDYSTGNATATGATDFVTQTGTLTFAPGETEKTVEVSVVGDRLDESDETFYLNLTNAVGAAIADNRGVATVTDDDAVPTVTIADVIVGDGNAGVKSVTFVLTLSQPSGQNVAVNYVTADGTASSAAGDFVARAGTVTFGVGATTQVVSITLNGDQVEESNETFYLDLIGITNGVLVDNQGLATIVDDDRDPGTLTGISTGATETRRGPGEKRHGAKHAKPAHAAAPVALPPDLSDNSAGEGTNIHKRGQKRK
jgi:subtilisin family serine protease/disulfide oxidoreductase YuzD/DNA-binding cell septation regulator SpoVG/subtilisin-like proprotein convertase family protein